MELFYELPRLPPHCWVNQEEHLGRGTRTNIYSGMLRVKSEEVRDAGYSSFQEVKVVLKLLGSGHRDISLVRETVLSAARPVSALITANKTGNENTIIFVFLVRRLSLKQPV